MMTSVIIMMMMVRFDWADGEPNNYEHHEMCLTLWEQHDPFFPIVRCDNIIITMMMIETITLFQARDYKWNDMSCDDPAHYICEMRCAAL